MKLSITAAEQASPAAPFVFRGDLSSSIRKASQCGYEAVELHIRDPKEVNQSQIEAVCSRLNMQVSSLGTGLGYSIDRLSLSGTDENLRERAVNRVASHIRLAKSLNCLVIIGLIKGQVKETGSGEEYEQNLTNSLNRCIELAEKENVTLVLEAVNRFESDNLNTIESMQEFIGRFKSDRLKLHIDTFHMNIEENSLTEPILKAKDVLAHVHFADNNRKHPGSGFFEFKKVIEALRSINYNGSIAMECLPLPTQEEAAANAFRYCSELIG